MGDKRTLLAFILIGAILLIMPRYYEWMGLSPVAPEDRSAVATPDDSSATAAEVPAGSGAAGRASEPSRPVAAPERRPDAGDGPALALPPAPAAGRRVVVETPLQRLVFSTAGGVLESVELHGYTVDGRRAVELLPSGARALGLVLQSEDGVRTIDLTGVEFTPDLDGLQVAAGGEGRLRLRADLGSGRYVEKRLTFRGDQYGIEVELGYDGLAEDVVAFLDWRGGIAVAEEDTSADVPEMRVMAYLNETLEDRQGEGDEVQRFEERGQLWWAGLRNRYFLAAFIPRSEGRQWVDLTARAGLGGRPPELDVRVGSRVSSGPGALAWTLYAGPLDYEIVSQYQVALERAMNLGWPVIREISKLLLVLFVAAHQVIPNYGLVIIVFALVVKLLVYPLTHKSYESAARMQELQPKIAALKEKYRNDNQRLSQETMKLYREEGVNPLGGCLPLVMQMPIFIALYQTFSSTIQLRHADFALWIDDLSRPDRLMVAGFEVHVLPLLMSAAMFFQSKMTMKDPKQAAMVYVMPLVMVFIMWKFSSGLVLYWTVFNVLQIGQQYLTNYLKHRAEAAPAG